MSARKNAANREKELRLAIRRIQMGKSEAVVAKLSIAGVAREIGVSASLIHNHYPSIAELIRNKQGASSRRQRDKKHSEFGVERRKNAALRRELKESKGQIDKLTTINEMLLTENKELKAKHLSGNVRNF